jgi:hypothetical protein
MGGANSGKTSTGMWRIWTTAEIAIAAGDKPPGIGTLDLF